MKNLTTLAISSVLLTSAANAAVTQIKDADNVVWTQPGFSAGGSTEQYDERSLHITDSQGLTIDSIRIILDTTGNFDDSLAVDIDADDTIDFIASQSDAYATAGVSGYSPWNNAEPFTLDFTITATGTTMKAYWGGDEINVGGVNGFNNVSSYTLADWGLGGAGSNEILSNNFTSTGIRLGSVNETGPSSSALDFDIDAVVIKDTSGETTVFDPDGDGVPQAVPEPSSALLVALAGLLGIMRRRRA